MAVRKVSVRKVPEENVSEWNVSERNVPGRKVPGRKVPGRKVPGLVKLLIGVWAAVFAVAAATAGAWVQRSPGMNEPVAVAWPSEAGLRAVGATKILFGHQSVGANILDGISRVYADASLPEPAIEDVYVGVNEDPLSKFAAFEQVMGSPAAADVEVALMKVCYLDITEHTDVRAVFDAYAAMMAKVEAAHPDVRFFYTTAPLTADRSWKSKIKAALGRSDEMGPADNVARERYNALIREKYAATGRLVDIAAAESEGTGVRSQDGASYYVLNEHLTSDRGHLNEAGSEAVAAELLKTVATYRPGSGAAE